MKCKLKLNMTSLSNKILNDKEYDWEPESLPVVGSYYFVMYEGELAWASCPGEGGGRVVIVKRLEKVNAPKWLTWKWPVKKDEHNYPICDVKNTTTATGWSELSSLLPLLSKK